MYNVVCGFVYLNHELSD